jgi:hypothetical protein
VTEPKYSNASKLGRMSRRWMAVNQRAAVAGDHDQDDVASYWLPFHQLCEHGFSK